MIFVTNSKNNKRKRANKKHIFYLLALVFNVAQAQPESSIGKEYYFYINSYRVEQYVTKNKHRALTFLLQAEKVHPLFGGDAWGASLDYCDEHDYKMAELYFEKALLRGMKFDYILSNALLSEFINSPYYKLLATKKDSLEKEYRSNLDLNYITFIYQLFGQDQIVRLSKSDLSTFIPIEYMHVIDSVSLRQFKEYIFSHGFPSISNIDYTTYNLTQSFFNHWFDYDTTTIKSDSIYIFFNNEFEKGNLYAGFFTKCLDYHYLRTTNKQLFGNYINYQKQPPTYNEFIDDKNIDRARELYSLYPLICDTAIYKNLILPKNYKYTAPKND